jgi:hypothetical protein
MGERRTLALPDGRKVTAQHSPTRDTWFVEVDGADHPWRGRHLDEVLKAVVLEGNPLGTWIREAVEQLSGEDTGIGRRYPCPCCNCLTLEARPPGTGAVCPVCAWQDDALQFDDPRWEGGVNGVSLRRARRNQQRLGASQERHLPHVRPPLPEEQPRPEIRGADTLVAFAAPVLVVTRGAPGAPYLTGASGRPPDIRAVHLDYGSPYTPVGLRTATAKDRGDEHTLELWARSEFGNVWNAVRQPSTRPPEPPVTWRPYWVEFTVLDSPPDPEEERERNEASDRRRRSIAAAIGRSTKGWSTVPVDGAEHRAYRIVHPKLFSVVVETPDGLAAVAGRGITLDELELSLAPDAASLLGVPPDPWDDD